MENASKALIMAGGVLISIIIISMLILVFNSLTNYQELNTEQSQVDAVTAFNNQYLPYNKDDVRGNELLTLANKVIDYNKRRTTASTDGSNIGYQPISLTIKYEHTIDTTAPDNEVRLFDSKNSIYTASGTTNDLKSKFNDIKEVCKYYPSEQVLDDLATGATKIFLENFDNETLFKKAVDNFNTCYGKVILNYNDNAKDYLSGSRKITLSYIQNGVNTSVQRNLKEDVYMYFEYKQFKRARFKCTTYETNSAGRVNKIAFEFTGEIN